MVENKMEMNSTELEPREDNVIEIVEELPTGHNQLGRSSSNSNDDDDHDRDNLLSDPSSATSNNNHHNEGKVKRRMMVLTCIAAIGGFLFGYDTGVISGAMLLIQKQFNLSPFEEEVVVTSTIISAFIFSFLGGSINQKIGRRPTIIWASFVFCFGSLILASAWNYESLVFGRFIIGIGIGLASLTTPVYIAEVSTPSNRGKLVTMNALLIPFGQFFAGIVDGLLSKTDGGWRYMLGLAFVPSFLMFLGFIFLLPESPRWLLAKAAITEEEKEDLADFYIQKAHNTLLEYRDSEAEVKEEMLDISNALGMKIDVLTMTLIMNEDCASNAIGQGSWFFRFAKMMMHVPTRRALFLGCGLMMFQQLSGINTGT